MHLFVLLDEEAQVDAQFGLFGDSANLDANRCTVCMEHTKCLENNLEAHDGTPRWRVSYEILQRSIWRHC